MRAKIKSGGHLLYTSGFSNDWTNLKDIMIINFVDRWTYQSFKQVRNHLIIKTTEGEVDIVFTGETPELEFQIYDKEQLILTILPKFELQPCEKCFQMTNHLNNKCQKCKVKNNN